MILGHVSLCISIVAEVLSMSTVVACCCGCPCIVVGVVGDDYQKGSMMCVVRFVAVFKSWAL